MDGRYVLVVTCFVVAPDEQGTLTALIVKRGENEIEGPGLWAVPGGKVENTDWGRPLKTATHSMVWSSVLLRAMRRELHEETSLKPNTLAILPESDTVFVRKNGAPTLVFSFWSFYPRIPPIVLGKELVDYRFVSAKELSGYPLIGNVACQIENVLSETRRHYA